MIQFGKEKDIHGSFSEDEGWVDVPSKPVPFKQQCQVKVLSFFLLPFFHLE
jgi:hypothetical protein